MENQVDVEVSAAPEEEVISFVESGEYMGSDISVA